MKHRITAFFTVISLLITVLTGCTTASGSAQSPIDDYSAMLKEGIPEDLCLTIYYMDPRILTRLPLSADDLINFSETKKIVVEAKELEENLNLLKKLELDVLQPAAMKSYIDARMYYVLASENSGKLLDVIISQIHGNVFVNGEEVNYDPVFLEIISPFLTEEARYLFKDRGHHSILSDDLLTP